MKELPPLHVRVLRLLPVGMDNPIPAKEISQRLDIDDRQVYALANELTCKYGIPVGALRNEKAGLFIPSSEHERKIGARSLEHQHKSIDERLDHYYKADLSTAQEYKKKYKHIPTLYFQQLTLGLYTPETEAKEFQQN